MELNDILALCVEKDASDAHFAVGRPVTLRLHGALKSIDGPVLTDADTERFMKAMTSETNRHKLEEVGGVDFGFAFGEKARFRASVYRERGRYGISLRFLPSRFFSLEEIGFSSRIKELLERPRGLFLVTGPTGSGKTTTLASMINHINETEACHIVTVEDPIEYYHSHKKSIVTQREIGVDVTSFSEALVKGLRMDPDVFMVGEMRDLATMESALAAAETGHLVFATLHTIGASLTVDRIIDAFPSHQQAQIRIQLSTSLLAVISQTLIPRVSGSGRVAAFEIMVTTPAIQNLIRESKTFRIFSEIQTGAKLGMHTMDSYLLGLYEKGLIKYEDMMESAYDTNQLVQQAGEIKKKR
ncbi:MAG: type IV pilus twitching motility protein PilT [Candidatus Omnitrophica bacterium]|nr:type IV pilus twitching motility protein PilT [Candidatus Omnitrophota bacterium]